jgi:hypothetical protein
MKTVQEKTDIELVDDVRCLVILIESDTQRGRSIWTSVAALHAITQEQRRRYWASPAGQKELAS